MAALLIPATANAQFFGTGSPFGFGAGGWGGGWPYGGYGGWPYGGYGWPYGGGFATGPQYFYSGAYDLSSILHHADLVTLMAYEEHGPSTVPGPVAGLDWDRLLLQGSLSHLSGSRALLGMPLYARSWTLTGAPADGYAPALETVLAVPGSRLDYDFGGSTPFVRSGAGDAVTYFDDADSLARKLALVGPNGLRGTAVWRLGFEDPAIWSLFPTKPPRP